MSIAISIERRIQELGLVIPTPAVPVANYVPFVQTGNLVSISGQIPMGKDGLEFVGKVGKTISTEQACDAAALCARNLIAQMKAACNGDLERVVRIVKLGGFVNCTDDYHDQPKVINAASDLMVAVFGDKGRHSRSAVGTNSLPLGVAVEIDAFIEIT